MSFLITGFGRSGTKFLSLVMNKSNEWTVEHEPRGSNDETSYRRGSYEYPIRVQDYFFFPKYGEVNSYMRFWFWDINVDVRGVIIRDPKSIIKSIANRKSPDKTLELLFELNKFYGLFKYWVKYRGITPILFKQMVSDKDYLEKTLHFFGIRDVDLDKVDLAQKINTNKNEKYKSFSELPGNIKDEFIKLDW